MKNSITILPKGVNFALTVKTILERLVDVFNDLYHTSVCQILILG